MEKKKKEEKGTCWNWKLQTLEFEIQKPSTQFFGTCNLSKV
jgi:hypothetical protein